MAYLAAAQRYCLAGAWGEEGRAGVAARRARPRGRHGQATRRRHAHPLGSAHADEGADDGAMATRSLAASARSPLALRC